MWGCLADSDSLLDAFADIPDADEIIANGSSAPRTIPLVTPVLLATTVILAMVGTYVLNLVRKQSLYALRIRACQVHWWYCALAAFIVNKYSEVSPMAFLSLVGKPFATT